MIKLYRLLLVISFLSFSQSSLFAAVTVTAPTLTITTCAIFPTSYNPLGNIVITEGVNGDFAVVTGGTLIFTAPANFEFLAGAGSVSATAGRNIDDATIAISVTSNSVTITYDVANTNRADAITISGLMIRATNTSAAVNITRTGGTGIVAGLVTGSPGTTVATLTCTSVGSPIAGSVVASLPNSICTGQTVQLYLSGSTTGTYQWQDSPDNISFTPITGETNSTYNYTPSSATTKYFRCEITCGSTVNSASYAVISIACVCSATTVNVDLSSCPTSPTCSAVVTNQATSGQCCGNTTSCVKFIVTVSPSADQFQVNKGNNSGGYYVNCNGDPTTGNLYKFGQQYCFTPNGSNQIEVTYCKSGGGNFDYTFTAGTSLKKSPDKSIRQGCSDTISTFGTLTNCTWSPSTYLNCTSCNTPTVTPTSSTPATITYTFTGTSTSCGSKVFTGTITVTVTPSLTVTPTATNSVSCSGSNVTLTAGVSGGSAPYTYSWSPGGGTSSSIVVAPTVNTTYTVSVNDALSNGCAQTNTITITTQAIPSAPTASASPNPICVGTALSLAATATGTTYSWTGPASFTSTSQNPTPFAVTTANAGTYSVTASTGGCTSSAGTVSVTVNTTPAAPSAGSNSTVCSGNTLSLTASGGAGTYAWTGPNSFSSASQNPTIGSVTTLGTGTYSVTETLNGCTGATGTVSVTIQQTPGAPTAGSNGPICSGSNLSLTASTITGATYSWSGPNSFTSTSQNPVINAATTAATGNYSVTATAGGCAGTAGTVSVTVNAIPVAPTAGSNSPICSGDNLSLTASSTGTTYNWSGPNSFSSASQNPVIAAITTAGSGTYSVTATTGSCTSPAGTTIVTINPIPAAPVAGSNSTVCSGNTLSLTASSTGTSYSWTGPNSFSSISQNPTIGGVSTLASGNYSVTATASGCTGPAGTTSVTITQTPAAPTAGSNSTICVGVTLSLTASSTGTSYNWSGPNSFTSISQNPTIAAATTAASGTYSVTATTSGCTGTAGTTSVTVSPPPAAPTAGSNTPVCAGNTLSLTASTVLGATYNWSGPNSFTSVSQNPTIGSVTTAGSGTYSVTATVAGCTGSAGTTSVTINAAPANPTAGSNSPVCSGNTLSLTSSSVTGATGYSWSGPNSFVSASQNPTIAGVTTLASGTYTVTATVPGCSNVTGTTAVTINETPASPVANNSGPICTGSNLSLTASSTGATYNWSGPNSYTSTSQNPVISPATTAAGGTYTVTATSNGCTSTPSTTAAIVHPFPLQPSSASGTPNPICSGQDLSLTAATNGAATYNWNGPNGYSATGQNQTIVAITTAGAGTYSVSYTINSCTGPATTFSVTVNQTPTAPTAGSNGPICAGNTLSLTASSVGTSYSWTGPNSFTSISQNPTIAAATTAATGNYSVTATTNGCTGPVGTISVTVNPPPAPPTAGNNSPICSGTTLSLTATTVTGATYAWTGPNSFSSTSQNPTIGSVTTLASGTYSVVATVAGCPPLSTVTTSVTINQTPSSPTAGSNTPVCVGGNLSLTASGSGTSYTWTGPNSFSSASQNPVINGVGTAEGGTYSVTTTSAAGCTSAITTASVIISAPPAAPTLGSNTPVCSGNTLSLTANTVASATYSWTGPNSFSSASQNPTIGSVTTLASGTYSATVTVPGCITSAAGTTSVTIFQTPAAPTAGNNSPICIGVTLSLTASTVGGSTYSWSGPDGFTSASQNPTIAAATTLASGTYSVTATENGCTGTAGTTSVTVSPPPATPTAGSNAPVCVANTLSLTASTVIGATYSWSGPNGFSSASQNPTIAGVSSNEAGTYSVTATIAGCTGSAGTISVTINPAPAAPTAGSNAPICSGNTLSLTASTISGASTYNWTGPNSFTSSTQDPTIGSVTTLASGTYSVTATVPGCPLSPAGTIAVTINQTPAAPTAGSNSPACVGGDISLTASGTGASYAWTGPNSYSSASQNPVISVITTAEAGTYTVNTTSAAGCTSSNTTTSVIVNPPPAAPSAGSNSATICSGSTLSLTASTIPGATAYNWSGPNSFTSNSQNPTIAGVTTAANGTYSVTAFVPGCALSAAGTVSVTVFQTPAAPTTANNGPICSGSDISLTASTIGGSTYSWTGPNSFSSTTQDPTIAAATTANTGLYSVTATENGCTGPAGTTSVTVNSIPSAPTAGSNSPLCSGATLSLTASTVSGATYTWSGPNSFSSASQNPTIANITTADAGTYSISATVLGCTGAFGTVSVSIAPPPTAPTAGSNAPICSGTTLSLTASTVIGASSYNWSGPNGFTSSTQDPTIGSVTTLATGTYSVSATVNGCTGPAGTIAITINQTPVAPVATNNGPLCIGDNLTLSAATITGATYAWTGPNSFSSASQNATISGVATSDAGTYSVTATVNGCTGPAGTTALIVAPPPTTPSAGSNSPVCSGQTLSLTANTISGASYNWSGPNSFTSISQNPTIASVTTLATGTYSVFVTIGSCTSPTGTVAVTIDQTPAAPAASSNSPICSGNDLSLTASTVGGSTYAWSGPNGFSSTTQDPIIIGITTADGGTYSVTATENGCTSPAGTTSVTINPIPAAPTAGNNGALCVGDNLTLTANTISGATYAWSGPNGFTSTLQNPTIAAVTTTEAGTYSVSVTVSGCPGPDGTTTLIVAPPPAAPTAGSNSPVCSGTDISLTANTISGATYAWTGPNSFTSSSQNPVITPATTADDGNYSVTVQIGSCISSAGTVSVTVNQSPVAPTAGSNSPICVGSDLSLTASTVGGSTYAWSGPNGFSSTSQNPVLVGATTAEAGTYSVTTTENGCPGPVATVTVMINPAPGAPTAGSNSPACTGQTLSLTANTIPSATYAWSGPNSYSSATQNPTILGITTAAAGTYSVTATVPGCPTSPEGTVLVTVNQTPAAPTAANNSPICSGSDLSLTASTVGGSTYTWSGPNGFTSTTQDPIIIGITTADGGTYSVTATENGCTSTAGTTSVTINPIPAAPTAGNNGPLCIGDNLTLTANTIAGATYAWTGPNGFTSTLQNPTIAAVTTTEAGTYSVSVIVSGCQGPDGTTTLIVAPPPAAPTAGSNSPVCSGTDISLTANTILGATYTWTGPNAFSSASQNPVITPATTANDGNYSVTVQIGSCISSAGTVSVTVNQSPVAPTAGSNSPVCAGSDLSLTASTISGVTYSWSGPNSFSSTTQDPILIGVTTAEAGTYSVTAISTTNSCPSSTSTVTVIISNPATVNAGSDQTVCANNAAQLSGVITGGAGTGNWTTPNGVGIFAPTTTALNGTYTPNINDTLAGDILLILTSTNNGGCTAAKDTVIMHVNRGPIVNAGVDQSICSNNYAEVAINGTIQFATGGDWTTLGTGSFVTTSTVLTNTYVPTPTDVANGSVVLVLTSTGNGVCNAVTDSLLITFTPSPVVNAGTNIPVCFGNVTAQLNGTVSGGASTGMWTTLGTGSFTPTATTLNALYNLSNADTTAGSVTLILTSTNNGNCLAETGTVTITMTPAPTVAAGSDVTLCANNDTVALNGSISGGTTTGYWSSNGTGVFLPDSSILNGNYIPSSADTAAGSIMLTLTSTNGCREVKDSLLVTITDAPVVNAGNDVAICGGNPVALNGSISSAATGGQWTSSGNGTFSPDDLTLNATYLPGSNDTAGVTLVLTSTGNGQCLAVTDTMIISVGDKPVAGFSNTQACTGQLLTFTDSSYATGLNDSIVSWNWTIAGANDTLQNPTHTYTASGTDTVTLVVTTNTGCTDTVMHVVNINPSPVAAYTYTVDCVVDSVYFTSTSTIPSGNIISWSWNLGDGNTSTQQNPVHNYTTAGTYTVILTVTSDSGCTSIFSDTVQSCNMVQAGFTSTSSACSGQAIAFTDTSMIVGIDSIATWSWNFGDGGTDTLQNPTHTYVSSGTFTVSLVVVTNSGATDTAMQTILINPAPVASFTVLSTCALDSVYFTDVSTITGGNIISWNWSFGDGKTDTVQNPVHYYDSTAAYVVSLTVTSDSGCTSTFTDTVVHAKDIIASFADSAYCSFNVQFTDTSLIASSDSIVSWIWNFGDGTSDTVQNPAHSYTASGTYTVQLVMTSSGGCTDTATQTITVVPLPVADFVPAGGNYYKGEQINFTDLSTNAASWMWDFGDGTSDSVPNPSHIYEQTGLLTVQLIVMNSLGCPDTAINSFVIYPNNVGVATAFTPNGDGLNDVLHVKGGPMKEMDWRIYNEWGNEVFHSTDQSIGWDATYKGKMQPATRYVYTLRGTTISGDIIEINGEVTIVR